MKKNLTKDEIEMIATVNGLSDYLRDHSGEIAKKFYRQKKRDSFFVGGMRAIGQRVFYMQTIITEATPEKPKGVK